MKYNRLLLASALLVFLVSQAYPQEDSIDPAARQLMESMDTLSQPTASRSALNADLSSSSSAVRSVTGDWHLELENGVTINLALSKSGSMVFGSGNVTFGASAQTTTASGSLSGNILRLNVVPADGVRLYVVSLDLSGQIPAKTYSIFSADAATSSGTIRKVSYNLLE